MGKFVEVTVFVRWLDAGEEEDLLCWSEHLYKVPNVKTVTTYRGFIPEEELYGLGLLKSCSPYGESYLIVEDKTLKEAMEILFAEEDRVRRSGRAGWRSDPPRF